MGLWGIIKAKIGSIRKQRELQAADIVKVAKKIAQEEEEPTPHEEVGEPDENDESQYGHDQGY